MSRDSTRTGDYLGPTYLVFFQFGRNIRQIGQISQIFQLSSNLEKPRMEEKFHCHYPYLLHDLHDIEENVLCFISKSG